MDFLGDDIKLDENGDLRINPGAGDFSTASGLECLLQDIFEEFEFSYLDDPEHPERGNKLVKYVNCDKGDKRILASEIKSEVKSILSRDPRIKNDSINVSVSIDSTISITASFDTVEGKEIESLVIPIPEGAII